MPHHSVAALRVFVLSFRTLRFLSILSYSFLSIKSGMGAEYQGKSGWSQSRFKKKNAATIEDYEQTVKYIKEHIKKYAVDGKPPTMLDLLEKSNKLKSKWNRLNVEHTAFLTKRETAKKYTRQVRQYINEQQMKREREKSRQRTQAKHRNKNTLE